MPHRSIFWKSILWIARATSILALIPVLLILVGEPGNGPASTRTWVYLAFFPIGFSAGYLFAWRWPIIGGTLSLACMAASLVVLNRALGLEPYLIWATLCIPALLFITAGYNLRQTNRSGSFQLAHKKTPVEPIDRS